MIRASYADGMFIIWAALSDTWFLRAPDHRE